MQHHLSVEEIRAYWAQQATLHGESPIASWSDVRVIELEIKTIGEYLADGDSVLDVGCANGFSTVQFAANRTIDVVGVDYIPGMIEHAQRRLTDLQGSLQGRVAFRVGNVLHLEFPDAQFDKVTVTRVIINLGDWADQRTALHECARVLKPGGLLLLSEATFQGWRRLNTLRNEWGLPDIPMPSFNRYVDEEQVVAALAPHLKLQEIVNFASTYYVGTRLLKPLLAQACGLALDVADPAMEWNRWCAQLPAAGDYGTQKLFVFRKADIHESA